jgi:putative tryptophan/tyrosine transport system substrate-binding protein
VNRRSFITMIGGAAAAWPLGARAQQAMPVIGFLSSRSPRESRSVEAAFRDGLKESGYVEGQNAHIAFRWADGQFDQLPALAGELVRQRVAVIVAIGGGSAALAAKAATAIIPIVFVVGFDPVVASLVPSFNRPGDNVTGMTLMSPLLGQKRLELLRELAPKAAVVAVLVNPLSPDGIPEIGDVEAAAQALGIGIKTFNASTSSELYTALIAISDLRPDALLVVSDPFFLVRREELIVLAGRIKAPVMYPFREFAEAGGLISYGANIPNAYRQAGIYAGRILKGAKLTDLPVMQPTKFELVLNLKTAKALGLQIPDKLIALADEVIE